VNASPSETGTELWKTIAPVMLPRSRGILVAPDPENGVELLGQLRGQRREHQCNQARRHAHGLGEVLHGAHEEVGPTPITAIVTTTCAATAQVGPLKMRATRSGS
jgi:hypothetical protein